MRKILIILFLVTAFNTMKLLSLDNPVFITPNTGDTVSNPVEIRWYKVPDAEKYMLSLYVFSSDGIYYSHFKDYPLTDTTISLTLPEGREYMFIVCAYSKDDSSGYGKSFFVRCKTLSPPELYYPLNHSDFVDTYPNFMFIDQCNKRFHFQLAYDSLFTNLEHENDYLNLTTYNYQQGLRYDTYYYWRVRSFKDSLWSDWSEVFTFKTRTEKVILEKPTLISPPDGSNIEPICSLKVTWNHVRGAINYIVMYSSDNFKTDTHQVKSTIETATINYLYNGEKYFWKVIATSPEAESIESDIGYFSTIEYDSTFYIYPKYGDTINPGLLTLKWKNIEKKNMKIQMSYSMNRTIPSLLLSETGDSVEYTFVKPNSIYYWSICDDENSCNFYLKPVKFFVRENPFGFPENPEIIYPKNNDSLVPVDSKLLWYTGKNATVYRFTLKIKVSPKIGFWNVYEFKPVSDTFFIPIVNLLPDTTYQWYVQGENPGETNEGFYKTYTFRTAATTYIQFQNDLKDIKITFNSGSLSICSFTQLQNSELFIYDLLGRILQKENLNLSEGENRIKLREDLPDYFIVVVKSGNLQKSKLILK